MWCESIDAQGEVGGMLYMALDINKCATASRRYLAPMWQ